MSKQPFGSFDFVNGELVDLSQAGGGAGQQEPSARLTGAAPSVPGSDAESAIREVAQRRGVNPDHLLGLARLETQLGRKSIRSGDDDTRNLFNIKDFSRDGDGVRARDGAEGSNDKYRRYADYRESTEDLISLLERRYPGALKAQTGEEFAAALKRGGYATDPNYVSKLTQVIGGRSVATPSSNDAPPLGDDAILEAAGFGSRRISPRATDGRQPQADEDGYGVGDWVKDNALAASAGVWKGIESLTNLAGADNQASGVARTIQDRLLGAQSPERKEEKRRAAERIQQAEEGGSWWEEIKANASAFADAPFETTVASLATSAPVLLSAAIGGGPGALGVAANWIARGAVGFAQGVGMAKGTIYEEVKDRLVNEKGLSEREAEQVATGAQAYDSENVGNIAINGLLYALDAGTGPVENVLSGLRRSGARSLLPSPKSWYTKGAVGALKEAPIEGVQGGWERYTQNKALQGEGFEVPDLQGVVGNAAGEALAAGGPGFAFGAIEKVDPIQPVRDKAQTPDSPLSRAAVQSVDAGSLDQLQPEPPVEPVDPISERVAAIETAIRQGGTLQTLRELGQSGLTEKDLLADLGTAANPKMAPLAREAALERVEEAMRLAGIAPALKAGRQFQALGLEQGDGSLTQQRDAAGVANRAGAAFQALTPRTPTDDLQAQRAAAGPGGAWFEMQQGLQPQGETSDLPSGLPQPQGVRGNADVPGVSTDSEAASTDEAPAPAAAYQPAAGLDGEGRGTPGSAADALARDEALTPLEAGAPAFERKARMNTLAELGYETVERVGDAWVMTNARNGKSVPLESPADVLMARQAIKRRIDERANAAATSPTNDLAEPTQAQKEAGNYKKGDRFALNGFEIVVENPAGSVRRGISPQGKAWETPIAYHYGDLVGTRGADGDKMDVFVGPSPWNSKVYVVDQVDPQTGRFDEHKVMMGFESAEAARDGYLANYEADWKGLGKLVEMPLADFQSWARSDAAGRPASASGLGFVYPSQVSKGAKNDTSRPANPVFTGGRGDAAADARRGESPDGGQPPGSPEVQRAAGGQGSADGVQPAAEGGTQAGGQSVAGGAKPKPGGVPPVGGDGRDSGRQGEELGSRSSGRAVAVGGAEGDGAAIERLSRQEEAGGRRVRIAAPDARDPRLIAISPLLDVMERQFGARPIPVVATGPDAFDGVAFDGAYFINLDSAQMSVAETIAHEFGHTQERRPDVVALEDAMYRLVPTSVRKRYYGYLLRTDGRVTAVQNARGAIDLDASFAAMDDYSQQLLRSELIRDFMGKRFNDKAWLERLARQKPKEFGEFVREWIRLLDGLIQEFRGALRRAKEKDVDALMRQHLAQLEAMKDVAVEVAAEWAKANPELATKGDAGADGALRYAKRAGPQESRPERQFLVPQVDGAFDADTGNLAIYPAIQLDGGTSFASMPVRARVGQHVYGPDGGRQSGVGHRVGNASDNPGRRGYTTPDIGSSDQATVERAVRDMAETILTATEAYQDAKFDDAIAVRSAETGNTAILIKDFDRAGQPFWSIKTLIPKSALKLREQYGVPVPIQGITLDGTDGSSSDAAVRETIKRLRSSVPFLGDRESYTLSDAGKVVNPDSAEAQAQRSSAPRETRPERGRVVKDASGKLTLSKTRQSARDNAADVPDGYTPTDALPGPRDSSRDGDVAVADAAARDDAGADAVLDADARPAARGGDRVGRARGGVGRDAAVPRRTDSPGVYGAPRDGAVSAVGYHFGRQPRERLSSAYYGTGLKGAERERLDRDDAQDIRPRIHFYVDAGNGIQPESGVGGIPHRLEMRNLYDVTADPLGLVRDARPTGDEPRANAWERAVMQAGFDGYLARNRDERQWQAVLLGKHAPVPIAGTPKPATQAQPRTAPREADQAPTRRVGDELVKRPTSAEVLSVVRAKPDLAVVAPTFRMEFGEVRVHHTEADAANAVLEDKGSTFRFSRRDFSLSDDLPKRYLAILKSEGYSSLSGRPVEVRMPGAQAESSVDAAEALEQMDRREEALQHVRECLL